MSGKTKLSDEEYVKLLDPMAKELSTMARWVSETRQRMIVIFEGRDTAGKGGSIDMFARLLNPRQCRVVALPSPSERCCCKAHRQLSGECETFVVCSYFV